MCVIPIPSNDYPSKLASISPTSVWKGNTHDDALACIKLHAWYARQIRKEIAMDKEKVSLRRDSREASRPGRWLPATEEAIEEVTTGERFWIMSHVKWMLGNCQPVQLRLHINEWPTHRPTVRIQRLSHAYRLGQPTWQVRWKRWKLSDRLLRDVSTRVYVILCCLAWYSQRHRWSTGT